MIKNLPFSYIEINKANLVSNINEFRNLLHKETKISAVIKSNAYGHGDNYIVKILDHYVDYFQVDSIIELERIKKDTKKEIFVFGYVCKDDLEKAIKIGCILGVFSFEHLLLINEKARKLNKKQKVHLSFDSYLGREGFMSNEIALMLPDIKKMKNILIDGVYSHFANIEDTTNFSHAQKQLDEYQVTCNLFKKSGFKNIKTHISATSGVLAYEKNYGLNNIVRIGIGLYGIWPSEYLQNIWNKKMILEPVLSLKTKIAQVKTLPKGHPIGYGLTYITKSEMKVAIIPMGYADGIDRGLSNIGEVLIFGSRCKILGRVAMNMFVVDVTHLNNIATEDEVVIIGKQGAEEITVEEIAKKIDSINYEVVTRLSPLLPRVVI